MSYDQISEVKNLQTRARIKCKAEIEVKLFIIRSLLSALSEVDSIILFCLTVIHDKPEIFSIFHLSNTTK